MPSRKETFKANDDEQSTVDWLEETWRALGMAGSRSEAIKNSLSYCRVKLMQDPVTIMARQRAGLDGGTAPVEAVTAKPEKVYIERISSCDIGLDGKRKV